MSTEVLKSPADRIQAAANALEYEGEANDAGEAGEVQTETPAEETISGEAATADDDQPSDQPSASQPGEPPANQQWAALRRHQEKFEKKTADVFARLDEREANLAKREDQVSAILDAFDRNPEEAFNMLAKQRGRDPDESFRFVAERKLNKGEPSAAEVAAELQRLRQELADRDKQAADHAKRRAEENARMQEHEAVRQYVDHALELDKDAEAVKQLPVLTALPKGVLAGKIEHAYHWWKANQPGRPWGEVLKALDEIAGEEQAEFERRRAARATGSPSQSPEAERVPVKPAATSRTISNQQQAQSPSKSNGEGRLPTKEERLARAAAALTDL